MEKTSKNIWVNEDGILKESTWRNFYDSFEKAKLSLSEAQRARVNKEHSKCYPNEVFLVLMGKVIPVS